MVYSSCITRADGLQIKPVSKGLDMVVNAYSGEYDYFGNTRRTWLLQRMSSQKAIGEVEPIANIGSPLMIRETA